MSHRKVAPSAREIADLMTRIRRLQEQGYQAEPSEREAVLAAKRELLARIKDSTR